MVKMPLITAKMELLPRMYILATYQSCLREVALRLYHSGD